MASGKCKYPEVAVLCETLEASQKVQDRQLLRELGTLLERDWRLELLEK